ncbi:MAG: Uma2 family endonuclease [Desulfamplus sp.]|nr:Uma2 family endonuclease [Desulfamplus sp.]
MNAQPQENLKITPEEYLEFERNSEIKHEYFDGEIFAMTGASLNHNLINANITAELQSKLKSNGSTCSVFSNDMRVKVLKNGKYTYPDVVIACDEIQLEDDEFDTLINPVVIIEVLSNSTEAYDRGKKFEHYQLIPSLKEYILVSQHACRMEKYARRDNFKWLYSSYNEPGESMEIDVIGCKLLLLDIYYRVVF